MKRNKAILSLSLGAGICLSGMTLANITMPALAATDSHIDRTVTVKSGNKVFSKEPTKIERYTKTTDLEPGEYLVSEEGGVKTVEKLTQSDAPILRIQNTYGDVRKGDSFDVFLSEDSEWVNAPTIFVMDKGAYLPGVKVTATRSSYNRITVLVEGDIPRGAVICIPVEATASGEKEFQTVTVESRNSGVSNKVVNFAKTGENDITIRMEKDTKITKNGDNEVTLILEEFQNGSFKGADNVRLTLPEGFEWDSRDKNVDITHRGRELSIDLTKYDTERLDSAYIKAKIEVRRDAQVGDVYASVRSRSINSGDLKVASYVDSDVSVTAEAIEVVSGTDVDGLYKAKLIIEENSEDALREGRTITVDGDEKVFSLQHDQNLKIARKRGDGSVMIDTRSSRALSDNDRDVDIAKIDTYRRGSANAANSFELRVKEASKRASKYEVEIPFVVAPGYEGDVILKLDGAGIRDKEVKIAVAKRPVDVEITTKEVPAKGTEFSDIVIKEKAAGALSDSSFEDGRKVSAKYQIESEGIAFDAAEVKVTEGDLSLSKDAGVKEKKIQFGVDKKSSQKSTITISGVKGNILKEDLGMRQIKMMFGSSADRHYFGDKAQARMMDYIKVVADKEKPNPSEPGQVEKAEMTTFRINSMEMIKTKNGQQVKEMMDAAPFIQDSRTMLPVRYIAESLGANVEYNAATRQAIFRTDTTIVSVSLDSQYMYVNGARVQLLSKPANVNGRIFLPVRSLAMAFNADQNIIWDGSTQSVTVKALQ